MEKKQSNTFYIPEENKPLIRQAGIETVTKWQNSHRLVDAWKAELAQNRLAYMITVTLTAGTTDTQANDIINNFYDRLNFLLFKNAYIRGNKWLAGICVRERQTAAMEYTLHYHIYIYDNGCYLDKEVHRERLIRKAEKAQRDINKNKRFIDSLHFRPVDRTDPDIDDGKYTAYTYLFKNFNKPYITFDQAVDSIVKLHPKGLLFGDNQLPRPNYG